MKKNIFLLCIYSVALLPVFAQDTQFSQFYANPLYLNPAMAGSAMATRAVVNYRNQWPALNANFITTTASVDTYFSGYNSGVGIQLLSDRQFSNLQTTQVALSYAYQLQLKEFLFLRAGFQGAYTSRSADFYRLTFGDQLTDNGASNTSSNDPFANKSPNINYADFSTGMIVYSEKFWAGISAHHINRPNQSFSGTDDARLPIKYSVQAGLKIPIAEAGNGLGSERDREVSFSPTMLYKKQGEFDQLDVGIYFTYSPIVLGLWYRGLPIKTYKSGINNHDAATFLVGYRAEGFSFGYSYDITISTLGAASGGSHEISISYLFDAFTPKQPRNKFRNGQMSCPKF